MGPIEKVSARLEISAEDAGAGRFRQGAILNLVTAQVPQRAPDQPCIDCLDHSPAVGRGRPAVPRQVAFWLVAFVLSVTMLGTTLPTPLYVIYQAQWHFSSAIVTVTFAVYAAAVLATFALLRPGSAAPRSYPLTSSRATPA